MTATGAPKKKAKAKKPERISSADIEAALKNGESFMYEEKPVSTRRTPCPKCEKGGIHMHGNMPAHWFDCDNPKCNWTTKPISRREIKPVKKKAKAAA